MLPFTSIQAPKNLEKCPINYPENLEKSLELGPKNLENLSTGEINSVDTLNYVITLLYIQKTFNLHLHSHWIIFTKEKWINLIRFRNIASILRISFICILFGFFRNTLYVFLTASLCGFHVKGSLKSVLLKEICKFPWNFLVPEIYQFKIVARSS